MGVSEVIGMEVSAKCKENLDGKFENLDIYLSRERDGLVGIEVSSFSHSFIKVKCYVDAKILKEMVASVVKGSKDQ